MRMFTRLAIYSSQDGRFRRARTPNSQGLSPRGAEDDGSVVGPACSLKIRSSEEPCRAPAREADLFHLACGVRVKPDGAAIGRKERGARAGRFFERTRI